MRKLVLFLLLCAAMVGVRAQTTYRYWLDYNLSTLQTVSGTGEVQFNLDVSGLARDKVHALHVQAVNGEGVVSSPLTNYFYLPTATSVSTTARYWFDNDESTQQTTNTVDGTIAIDVTNLSAGFHAVHYQTFGQDGKPSSVVTDRFYLEDLNNERLTCHIWFDDEDEGDAIVKDVIAEGIEIDVSSLEIGEHTIHVALFDEFGCYVDTQSTTFDIPIPTESITLAKATGGTYCPGMDLDFSDVSGLKAYIAVGFNPDEGVVWIMRVNYVPANEGIMIKGTPGTYDVPYRQTSFHYNNLLMGSHDKRTLPVEEDGYYNYVLKNGLFCPSDGSASVGVNKAYLRIPTSWVASSPSLGRELMIEDIDDPTGITNVQNNADSRARYYNLNGQRIEHPQKGLYIRNGKKVMIR